MTELKSADEPPTPTPTTTGNQFIEGLKIFTVIVLVLSGQGAVQAYNTAIDWSKINDTGMVLHLLTTAWHGFLAGAINGSARSIQVVMAVWAGPTVWKYVSPVVGAGAAVVSKMMTNFAALFKRNSSGKTN